MPDESIQTPSGHQDITVSNQLTPDVSLSDARRVQSEATAAENALLETSRLRGEINTIADNVKEMRTLVVVGLIALIVITATVVVAVFIFFTQTAIDTHRSLNNSSLKKSG